MRFADIKGLDDVKQVLINGVKNNHIAHAQLFAGGHGSAALPLALAYNTYLNCENRGEHDACGQCPSCVKNLKYIHPDTHFVFPVSATKKISGKDAISRNYLSDWRSFLLKTPYGQMADWSMAFGGEDKNANISKEESRQIISALSLKAFEGAFKTMIIWLPEYMHPSAANGILKILEEPPEQTIFLLVSNEPKKLLATIISRVQQIQIRPFNDEELTHLLVEEHQVPQERAAQLARLADGNLNEARQLLETVEDDSHEMFREWMRFCFQRDFTKLIEWSERFQGMSKIGQNSLLLYGLNMMREVLVHRHMGEQADVLARVQGTSATFVENFSKVLDDHKTELISKFLNDAHYHLERNASARIVFLDLSLQIAGIIK